MKTRGKYIVFYCDDCDLLSDLIKQMLTMYPGVDVKTSSNVEELLDKIKAKLPDVILVYMTIRDESFVSVVKRIRASATASNTPVVIYQALPDEGELRKLSSRID
jgi:DNA-binding response OmpR family regulator